MVAPKIAAIIARQALSKFGDQLPEGVKETIGFIDNPKAAVQSAIRGAVKERVMSEMMGDYDPHQFEVGMFPKSGGGKPQFDEAGMSVEAFKRGGKVKAKPARRIDGIAQRGKTRGRYL
jgi:hypothetical protein